MSRTKSTIIDVFILQVGQNKSILMGVKIRLASNPD